jgi:hypothetical protein
MKTYGRMEVQLHTFLISALDGHEWSVSRPGRLSPWKEPRYPLNMRLGGPQSRCGHDGEDTNSVPLPGIGSRASYKDDQMNGGGRWAGHVTRMLKWEMHTFYLKNMKGKLGRPTRIWEDNIKTDLWRYMVWRYGLDQFGSGQGPVAGSCENGNVPSGSTRRKISVTSRLFPY